MKFVQDLLEKQAPLFKKGGPLEKFYPLFEAGDPKIRRASHVEPTPDGRWQTDLSPIRGPLLSPTNRRATALVEEVKWIQEHFIRNVPG